MWNSVCHPRVILKCRSRTVVYSKSKLIGYSLRLGLAKDIGLRKPVSLLFILLTLKESMWYSYGLFIYNPMG